MLGVEWRDYQGNYPCEGVEVGWCLAPYWFIDVWAFDWLPQVQVSAIKGVTLPALPDSITVWIKHCATYNTDG